MKRTIALLLSLLLLLPAVSAFAETGSEKRGAIDGTSYTNTYFGLSCQLSEDWFFYSDEEIDEVSQATLGSLDAETAEKISEEQFFTDMIAEDTITGANVNVTLEKVSFLLFAKTYRDISCSQLAKALESAGMENVTVESCEIPFMGTSAPGILISFEIEGVTLYEAQVYVKTRGYIATVTAVTPFENNTQAIFSLFSDPTVQTA